MELNEKQEKGVEFIENGLKLLKGEKISDGVWGAPKEDDNKEKDKKQN